MRHPFLRTLAASPRDPDFLGVTALLHADGPNGALNDTVVDSSANNITTTANNLSWQGSFSPYGDRWSNYFDGSADYLTVADNAAFDFGTGDFTIECWFYIDSDSLNNSLLNVRRAGLFSTMAASGVRTNMYRLVIDGSTSATGTGIVFTNWQSDTAYVVSATTTVSKNAWHHVAVARSGTTTKLFLDGSEIGSGTLGNQTVNSANDVKIGRTHYFQEEEMFIGYISNLRVLKGTALYTGSYTVPTGPLTSITNTSLLTCQSNRFIDNSSNNFTITPLDGVSIHTFSPFKKPSSYSPSEYGGSVLFNAGSEYIGMPLSQTPLLLGSSDWSFEAWVQPIFPDDLTIMLGQGWGSASNSDKSYDFCISNAGTLSSVYQGSSQITIASPNAPINQWSHVVWARTGGTFSSYLNGVRVGTVSTLGSTALNNGSTSYAPRIGTDTEFPTIYISSIRLIKGSGGYNATSSTITVPTTPPTAVTNTSLLLNFTNAGSVDSSRFSSFLTTAPISTSVKKYGTGSFSFNGSNRYISLPGARAPYLNFRSGNFTVEFWLYLSATGGAKGLIGHGANNNIGWAININASNQITFQFGSTVIITSSVTLSASTWYHIAVVREGTGTNQLKMYIDGTNRGTGTLNANIASSNDLVIGVLKSFTTTGYLNGYMDDIRITVGAARYTANFTAPTAAFPDL